MFVPTRLPSMRKPPLTFAHRGASAHAPENTLEAFTLGLRLGAAGLESDAWITADQVAILDHDGLSGGRLRRQPVRSVNRSQLRESIPSISELYETCGTEFDFSIDIKDPDAIDAVVHAAVVAGGSAFDKLWICHPDIEVLSGWRSRWPTLHLVHSTWLSKMHGGAERHGAELASRDIDAVNLHHSEWTGGYVALFHRFERLTFAWDVQFERIMDELFDSGIDGVYSDHTDRLIACLSRLDP